MINKKSADTDVRNDLTKIKKKLKRRIAFIKKYGTKKDVQEFIEQLNKVKRYVRRKKNDIVKMENNIQK
jgi:hypothetical protein